MFRNIILVLVGLAIAYIGYQAFDLYRTNNALSNVPKDQSIGAQDADLSVVEFLDYGCPYCRQVHPTITAAVQQDGNILYVPRPVAFLGEKSAFAAVVAYGAAKQGKFIEMHDVLIRNFETLSENALPDIAAQAGVDIKQLHQDLSTEGLQERVIENIDLFEAMGGKATPTFIIGKKIFYVPEGQMPEVEDFLRMFEQARGNTK